VPCSFVGRAVWAKIIVYRVVVLAQNNLIAEYPRAYERNQMITVLDHCQGNLKDSFITLPKNISIVLVVIWKY
jgi:hypothetical protein